MFVGLGLLRFQSVWGARARAMCGWFVWFRGCCLVAADDDVEVLGLGCLYWVVDLLGFDLGFRIYCFVS